MERKRTVILPFVLGLVVVRGLSAQWVQASGPGGITYSETTYGNGLVVGTYGHGVFLSADSGRTWTNRFAGLSNLYVLSVCDNKGTIFAGTDGLQGTGPGGIFRSTDNGQSWTLGGPTNTRIDALGSEPSKPGEIFAGTYAGVFKSTDDGTNWAQDDSGLTPFAPILSFGFQGTNVIAAAENGVYRSTDDGVSWAPIGLAGSVVWCVAIDSSSPEGIFVGTDGHGVSRSTDNGATWTTFNSGLTDSTVYSLATNGSDIYAGTMSGVFKSTNEGASWVPLNVSRGNVYCFSFLGKEVFAATQYGVFSSSDAGMTWGPVLASLPDPNVRTLAINGSELLTGTNSGLFASTSDGVNWTSMNISGSKVYSLAIDDTVLFAATDGGLMSSDDRGQNWNVAELPSPPSTVVDVVVDVPYVIAAVRGTSTSAGGVYLSSDNGRSWSLVNSSLGGAILCTAAKGSYIYAGTDNGVYCSTDYGKSWNSTGSGPTNVLSICLEGSKVFAASNSVGIFVSTDNGDTWVLSNNGLTNPYVVPLAVKGADVFAGTSGGEVFLTVDSGVSWSSVSDGLGQSGIYSLAFTDSVLFAGSYGSGVWKRPLREMITAIDAKDNAYTIPAHFALAQNYPNPFNPTTVITYDIHKLSHVSLIVYDILGRQIETLVNSDKSPGHYQVTFGGSRLPSGVYFYRLEAGNYMAIRKLMLLK